LGHLDIVQRRQVPRREPTLEYAIAKLDKYQLMILDDSPARQAEIFVLCELISARYERRSLLITATQPSGECNRVFPDTARTPMRITFGRRAAAPSEHQNREYAPLERERCCQRKKSLRQFCRHERPTDHRDVSSRRLPPKHASSAVLM